jgi:hypothetical protein
MKLMIFAGSGEARAPIVVVDFDNLPKDDALEEEAVVGLTLLSPIGLTVLEGAAVLVRSVNPLAKVDIIVDVFAIVDWMLINVSTPDLSETASC